MNTTQLLNKLTHLFGKSHEQSVHPHKDWAIFLCVLVFGIVASFVWNTLFFLQVVENPSADSTISSKTTASEISLEMIDQSFIEREAEAERYESEYLFVDPSR